MTHQHVKSRKKAVWMLFLSQCKCLWKEGVSMCSSFSSLSILNADKLQNHEQRQASTLSPSTMWLLTYPRNKPCGKFLSDLRRIDFAVSFAFHVLTSDAGFGASLVTWQPTWEPQWSVQWDQSLIEMKERSDGTIVWERLLVKLDSNDF